MAEAQHTVKSYEEELKNLNSNIVKMGSACEEAGKSHSSYYYQKC